MTPVVPRNEFFSMLHVAIDARVAYACSSIGDDLLRRWPGRESSEWSEHWDPQYERDAEQAGKLARSLGAADPNNIAIRDFLRADDYLLAEWCNGAMDHFYAEGAISDRMHEEGFQHCETTIEMYYEFMAARAHRDGANQ